MGAAGHTSFSPFRFFGPAAGFSPFLARCLIPDVHEHWSSA